MPPRVIVCEKTFILIDLSPENSLDDLKAIQRFLFLYLLHPLVNPASHLKSVTFHPISSSSDVIPSLFDWDSVVRIIGKIKTQPPASTKNELINLLTSLNQILSYINHDMGASTKQLKYHLVVISSFQNKLNWNTKYKDLISSVGQRLESLYFIDTSNSKLSTEYYDVNISIIKSLTRKGVILKLATALEYLNDYNKYTLPAPDPRDLFHNGTILIPLSNSTNPHLANLEFNIHMYPLVKSKVLSNYISNKLISPLNGDPVQLKYNYYVEKKIDPRDPQKRRKVAIDKDQIQTGLNVGNSHFKSHYTQFNDIETCKSMTIYGFTRESNIIPWYLKPDCVLITPVNIKGKGKAKMDHPTLVKHNAIFFDLVQYLASEKLVALVRMVKRDGAQAKQAVLFPRAYVDEETEGSGILDKVLFIMVECIYLDDEKIPNLPNLNKVEVEEEVQNEMDKLIGSFNLIDEDDLLTCDESLVGLKEYHGPLDKFIKDSTPRSDQLLIDGTFTGLWRDTVSFNEHYQILSSNIAFEVLNRYLDSHPEQGNNIVPQFWKMYFDDKKGNEEIVNKSIKNSGNVISEPQLQVVKQEYGKGVDWSKFKVEYVPREENH